MRRASAPDCTDVATRELRMLWYARSMRVRAPAPCDHRYKFSTAQGDCADRSYTGTETRCLHHIRANPSSGYLANSARLLRRELTRSARAQRTERHGSETHTHKTIDLEVERFTQASNFARAPFRDCELEFPFSSADGTALDCPRQHDAVFELDALTRAHRGAAAVTMHRRDVRALDLAARMRQPMSGV